jgi:cation diffusion facilitator CzcD-associated flavoprotein CzcO
MFESNKFIEEYGKVPLIADYDVLVAGGGVAGVAAVHEFNKGRSGK